MDSSSSSSSSSSEDETHEFGPFSKIENSAANTSNLHLLERTILHVDVDCFYAQCEMIENPLLRTAPLAIGQKHIIVTSNYIARSRGVKKLMNRQDAIRLCPSLVIVEGSDLTRYRRHSRDIYSLIREEFRNVDAVVSKGGMDEAFADVTGFVRGTRSGNNAPADGVFVYGDHPSCVSLAEDQSGASCRVTVERSSSRAMDGIHGVSDPVEWGGPNERSSCAGRLSAASRLGVRIQSTIHQRLGFRVCVGISVSPMLAKIAAELQKPNSVNVLYPWRAFHFIQCMPLRKVPQLGSRHLRALDSCLNRSVPKVEGKPWTCDDLLRLSFNDIVQTLERHGLDRNSSRISAERLVQKCKGIDTAQIIDDGGGLPKTVSVEDSFRRGTIVNDNQLWVALKTLSIRLPKLLIQRQNNSHKPELAYPKTLRVTTRNVEGKEGANYHLKQSKQFTFHGMKLLGIEDEDKRAAFLFDSCQILLRQLLTTRSNKFNITRLNVAVTNFSDSREENSSSAKSNGLIGYFSSPPLSKIEKSAPSSVVESQKTFKRESNGLIGYFSSPPLSKIEKSAPSSVVESQKTFKREHVVGSEKKLSSRSSNLAANTLQHYAPDGIDPEVFSQLPKDIQEELVRQQNEVPPVLSHPPRKKPRRGIEQYFCKQKD